MAPELKLYLNHSQHVANRSADFYYSSHLNHVKGTVTHEIFDPRFFFISQPPRGH
jgi:hypothetical protein